MIHLLEMPRAWIGLNAPRRRRGTVFAATRIFGFTWWIPARRGIHAWANQRPHA